MLNAADVEKAGVLHNETPVSWGGVLETVEKFDAESGRL